MFLQHNAIKASHKKSVHVICHIFIVTTYKSCRILCKNMLLRILRKRMIEQNMST